MAYKVPQEIVDRLQQKYPDVNVSFIIHDLFDDILRTTISKGSCTVKQFGRFLSFVTFSNKTKRDTLRFKFRTNQTLISKISNDPYLIKQALRGVTVPFTQTNEENCKPYRDIRADNIAKMNVASRKEAKEAKEANDRVNFLAKLDLTNMLPDSDIDELERQSNAKSDADLTE